MNMKKLLTGFVLVLALLVTVVSALAEAPAVTLVSPNSGTTDTDGNVTFTYTVADAENNVTRCELWTNHLLATWAKRLENTSVSLAGNNTFTINSIADNTAFSWNIACIDSENNTAWAAANSTLNISVNDAPVVAAISNQEVVVGNAKQITLTITDPETPVGSLAITAASSDPSKVVASIAGTSLTLTGAAAGSSTITITASDGALNSSKTFTATARAAQTNMTIPSALKAGDSSTQRNTTKTVSFVVSNPGVAGDATLTNLRVYFSASSSYSGNVTFSDSASGTYTSEYSLASLAPGASQTVYAKVFIPEDAYGGVASIGKIYVESSELTSQYFDLQTETKAGLKFNDLDISVSEGEDNGIQSESDGYIVAEEARPGTDIEISFKLENTFSSSEDISIEDITATLTIDEMGDEEERDEEIDVENLDAGDESETYTANFSVPYQLEEGKYDLIFEVEGTDDNDAEHRLYKRIQIEVVKDTHGFEFDTELESDTLCAGGSTTLNVEVFNIGTKNEEDVEITVKNTKLGINLKQTVDKLDYKWDDDDNSDSLEFAINIPENATADDYMLIIEATRAKQDDAEAESKVELMVDACKAVQDTAADEEEEIEVQDTKVPVVTPEKSAVEITESAETPFLESNTFVILLIAGIAVVVVLIGLLLVMAFRR